MRRAKAMPDVRPQHSHVAHSLYGPHGPQQALGHFSPRPLTGQISPKRFGLGPPEPPASISEHISHAVAKIPDLSPKQRNSVHAAMLALTRDISFVKMVHDQVGWSPKQDEGRLL
jgi:hypothetical protein